MEEQQSLEYREHVSRKYLGVVRGPLSVEHRAKLSAANKGKHPIFSAERNKKISIALKGKPKSLEHRAALSRAKLGKPRWKAEPILLEK